MAKKPLPTSIPRTRRIYKSKWGEVTYQAWGLGDQSILLQALTPGTDETAPVQDTARHDALVQVLENCVVDWDNGKNIRDMPLFLSELILLKIRALSIGEEATVAKKCHMCPPEDKHPGKIAYSFNIDEIEILEIEGHQSSVNVGDFTFHFQYPSLRGTLDLAELDTDNFSEALMIKFIKEISTEDEVWVMSDYTEEEKIEFAKMLGGDIQIALIKKFAKTMPYVGIKLVGKCDKCEKVHEIEIKGASKLFRI